MQASIIPLWTLESETLQKLMNEDFYKRNDFKDEFFNDLLPISAWNALKLFSQYGGISEPIVLMEDFMLELLLEAISKWYKYQKIR